MTNPLLARIAPVASIPWLNEPVLQGCTDHQWSMFIREAGGLPAAEDLALIYITACKLESEGVRPLTAVREAIRSLSGKTRLERDMMDTP